MSLGMILGATAAATISGAAISASAQSASANFNQQVAERNAGIAEQQGEQTRLASELQIEEFKDSFRSLQSRIEAQQYSSGVEVGTGTALDILIANAEQADQEIANRRFNAASGQRAAEDSAVQMRLQGQLSQMQGRQARIGTFVGAGTSLLNTYMQAKPYLS